MQLKMKCTCTVLRWSWTAASAWTGGGLAGCAVGGGGSCRALGVEGSREVQRNASPTPSHSSLTLSLSRPSPALRGYKGMVDAVL